MVTLIYDIWNEIINDVVEIHAPFFDAMKIIAENLDLSSDAVNEL